LAYQQTSAGDGGFNSIFVDDNYSSRYLGDYLAIGLDWLDGYAGFQSSLKTEAMNMLVRWSDYLRDNGYLTGHPESNHEAGSYLSRALTALALEGRDSRSARLDAEIVAYHQQTVVPLLQNPTSSLKGGYWAEGWNYGNEGAEYLFLAALALENGHLIHATAERQWANDVIEHLVSAQSSTTNVYDGGDWYIYPTKFLDKSLFYYLSNMASDPSDRAYANYILQKYPDSAFATNEEGIPPDTADYRDLLFHDPATPATFWSALPLQHFATGTGLLTARSDWGGQPVWVSEQMNNLLGTDGVRSADHQNYGPGHLELARGSDQLLIDAEAAVAGNIGGLEPYDVSQYKNTVAIDDNGDGLLRTPFCMNDAYGTPGVVVKAYEGTPDHAYLYGDYRAAYSSDSNPGDGGPASELTRQVVYLRPDFVVVYDRVTTIKAAYPKQLRWHFLTAPSVTGNRFVETVGNSRLFGATFSTAALKTTLTTTKVGDFQDVTIQRLITQNARPAKSVRYITAFQVADKKTGKMVATTQVLSTDGLMEGVQMGNDLVLFGRQGDVSSQAAVTYTITSRGTVHHYLVNLKPGQYYQITDNGKVVATVTASDQGTLRFDTTATGGQTIQVAATSGPLRPNLVAGAVGTEAARGLPSAASRGPVANLSKQR
jgi:hypothetical protein